MMMYNASVEAESSRATRAYVLWQGGSMSCRGRWEQESFFYAGVKKRPEEREDERGS